MQGGTHMKRQSVYMYAICSSAIQKQRWIKAWVFSYSMHLPLYVSLGVFFGLALCCGGSSSSGQGGYFCRRRAVGLFVVNVEPFQRFGGTIRLCGFIRRSVESSFCGLSSLRHVVGRRSGGACRRVGHAFCLSRLFRCLFSQLPRLGERADDFSLRLALLGTKSNTGQSVLSRNVLPQQWSAGERAVALLPANDSIPCRVGHAQLAKCVVELAAVLLGDVLWVNEGFQRGLDLVGSEHKDLGHGDGIKPALDPAPDCAEEDGRADDEDSIQRLGIVCRGQL